MRSIRTADLWFLLFICLIWGFNLIAVKMGLGEFPPIFFAFLRFASLAIVLAPVLRLHREQMGALVIAAVLCGALNFGVLFYGMSLTDNVAMVAIASQLGLPFTTLLSIALLGEVVRWRRWLGIALSFAGVLIMGFDPRVFRQGVALLLVIAAAFIGALGTIAIKRVQGVRPIELQAWFAMSSWPALLILTLWLEHGQADSLRHASAVGWFAVGYVAFLSSLVAHTGYYHLIQRYPVSSVAPLTVLSPLFSVIFSITLLGTPLTMRLLLGGGVTLAGVVIIALRERKIMDTGS
ncbi:MAG: DMT family transporter [Steroidobacteraceae bacterium]